MSLLRVAAAARSLRVARPLSLATCPAPSAVTAALCTAALMPLPRARPSSIVSATAPWPLLPRRGIASSAARASDAKYSAPPPPPPPASAASSASSASSAAPRARPRFGVSLTSDRKMSDEEDRSNLRWSLLGATVLTFAGVLLLEWLKSDGTDAEALWMLHLKEMERERRKIVREIAAREAKERESKAQQAAATNTTEAQSKQA